VDWERPWLRKNPKVFGLGVVVGSGNKPMAE
jgi:hypothetical protein